MNIKKYFALFLLIPICAFTLHKYYISLCEIEYVKEEKSLEIVLGMFIDDLEFTLNKNNDKILYLATPEEAPNIDQYYKNYLDKHFKISVNYTAQSYEYIGKEYDNDVVRFYLEATNIEHLNSLEIINTSLFRDFEDQQNIIKIKVKKFHKTLYLNRKNNKGMINF
jgi:hypothetical protein